MTRIGVTGHRNIPDAVYGLARDTLTAAVREHPGPVEALSSLAAGADQLFAEVALDCGAELTVVTPCAGYEVSFAGADELDRYHRLLDRAHTHVRMDFPEVSDQAFYAAGVYVADHSDLILAVWDGRPARGHGGTADIVEYARRTGTPVTVIWQPGVERD
ncbi:hypothetical protein QMK19_15645 [Streptomyces sp. H10-C2]|uniref:hypothetical protein n=1 Tax=unclassified Streptomyces TaxID=2593676 RepID=UPI0024BBD21B|nr:MULTISPECIES: hypothetical protein [unclassified Streptomyces]MDJ0343138.1 hypothetical protein [Streptomyces sp. PH10-H1]MDJ0371080.1 hypothetical protein [Streptomyces sp. H10-C2]